jgi:hypothetical protein
MHVLLLTDEEMPGYDKACHEYGCDENRQPVEPKEIFHEGDVGILPSMVCHVDRPMIGIHLTPPLGRGWTRGFYSSPARKY